MNCSDLFCGIFSPSEYSDALLLREVTNLMNIYCRTIHRRDPVPYLYPPPERDPVPSLYPSLACSWLWMVKSGGVQWDVWDLPKEAFQTTRGRSWPRWGTRPPPGGVQGGYNNKRNEEGTRSPNPLLIGQGGMHRDMRSPLEGVWGGI